MTAQIAPFSKVPLDDPRWSKFGETGGAVAKRLEALGAFWECAVPHLGRLTAAERASLTPFRPGNPAWQKLSDAVAREWRLNGGVPMPDRQAFAEYQRMVALSESPEAKRLGEFRFVLQGRADLHQLFTMALSMQGVSWEDSKVPRTIGSGAHAVTEITIDTPRTPFLAARPLMNSGNALMPPWDL